jgi:translation initiation factor IF-1
MILLNTGTEVQATFPGKFRKKLWIHVNNIVLVNESYEILDLIKEVVREKVVDYPCELSSFEIGNKRDF